MAKTSNNRAPMFLSIAMIICLLSVISMAEGRSNIGTGFQKAKSTLACESVINVNSGDTCADIVQTYQLSTEFFQLINPNLNCDALFVGQWLCVDGTAS